MARRDRTTGLPRPRARTQAKQQSRFSLTDQQQLRIVWIAGAVVIALIVAFWGWRWYDGNILQPGKTVLTVGQEKYSLRYYTDRLFLAAQASQGSGANATILEQTLFTNLEDEALAKIIAEERGITVSDEEITTEIAAQLGVPAGGAGTTFDALYRQRLRTTRMTDDHYRRYTEAQVFLNKLSDALTAELGDTGELVTIRKVVVATKAEADAIVTRLNAGEDLGTVAQGSSIDLNSRQNDGLDQPIPTRLLPESVRAAIGEKGAGSEIFGPVEVQGGFQVFRIQARESGTLSETDKSQLADLILTDALKAKRAEVRIRLDMDSSDYDWANEHAGD